MKKIMRLGTTNSGDVYVELKITEKENGERCLSIVGVEGPMTNGDCRGSCGQITLDSFTSYAQGWSESTIGRLAELWKRWHLNDMRPGCEHQRAAGWHLRPIDPKKPLDSYGRHFAGQAQDSWNMLTWVRPDEHPDGLLAKPCEECGYRYGTQWIYEEIPQEVIDELLAFPSADRMSKGAEFWYREEL